MLLVLSRSMILLIVWLGGVEFFLVEVVIF